MMDQQKLLDWLSKEKRKDDAEIEKYKKPTDSSQVALWIVSVAAIVVVLFDLFVWRP